MKCIYIYHLIFLSIIVLSSCKLKTKEVIIQKSNLLKLIDENKIVMFIGAHPDDETIVSPILAYCSDICRKVYVVSATKGEAGWNLNKEILNKTLAEVRTNEFKKALSILNCYPIYLDYINGLTTSHPENLAILDLERDAFKRWRSGGEATETVDQVWVRWSKNSENPEKKIFTLLLEKQPDIVITFNSQGWATTQHREHQVISKARTLAVKKYNNNNKNIKLFYYYPKKTKLKNSEIIKTSELSKITGKDYLKIARKSQSCYETQYGSKTSKRNKRCVNKGKKKIALMLVN